MRFFDFKSVRLVHIGGGPAAIVAISGSALSYTDDQGAPQAIDLEECARVYRCLTDLGAFPPGEDMDWGALVDTIPGFSDLPLRAQSVVGLRGALDEPPWFQFLDRRRTQFEFKDHDHIKSALVDPLSATRWYSWDAC